jgi:hypothetical protein
MPPDTSEGEIRRRYIRALAAPPARDRLGTSGIAAPPAWQRVSAAKGQRVKKNLYGRVAENRFVPTKSPSCVRSAAADRSSISFMAGQSFERSRMWKPSGNGIADALAAGAHRIGAPRSQIGRR